MTLDDRTQLIISSKKDPVALSIFLLEDNPGLIKCDNNIYLYNGRCYDLITTDKIMEMFHRFVIAYGISTCWSKRRDVVDSVLSYEKVPSVPKMNDYADLICVNNGILNIATRELLPHSSKYYFDSIVNVDYDPGAKDCPSFMKFLSDVFNGDQETIDNVIMLGGYLLDTNRSANKMFIFKGSGGNGKSVLIDTFSMFFGDSQVKPQVTSISLSDLSSDKFKKYDLITSRFNQCAEEKKGFIDAEEIKKIISGELINVAGKYKDTITFRPKTVIVVACNEGFKFTDNSDGISRRLVIINFKNQYKDPAEISNLSYAKERHIYPWDLDLPEKIRSEKGAILNLFLDGLIKLKERKYQFILGVAYNEELSNFRRDSDTVREFLEENYQIDMSVATPIPVIYQEFRRWYRNNVQDSAFSKFRSNELGRRIKEVFGIDSAGVERFYNKDEEKYERVVTYHLSKIIIEPPDIIDGVDWSEDQTPEQAGLKI